MKFQSPPIQGEVFSVGDQPSPAWLQWFQLVASALSTANVPASSTAAGLPGQMANDGAFLYVCVSKNLWQRIALTAF